MFFESVNDYKGFRLVQSVEILAPLAVLTGMNGCGKTRFLESVKSGDTRVSWRMGERSHVAVTLIESSQIKGGLSFAYDPYSSEQRVSEAVSAFEMHKAFFASPDGGYKSGDVERPQYMNFDAGALHREFGRIANRLGKAVGDLSSSEIRLHFVEPVDNVFSLQFAKICNEYLFRRQRNLVDNWRRQSLGHEVEVVPLPEFESVFGEAPWQTFNSILNELFDGKFSVAEPVSDYSSYDYKPELIGLNGLVLGNDSLSSGEQTLLWLSVTLFNMLSDAAIKNNLPEVVLLDEPDAFLHPQMVVKMYGVLNRLVEVFKCQLIMTTHSPTTVALAPDSALYAVSETSIETVSKDEAIADLLVGVSQISISPENRREVFVEGVGDAYLYRYVFDYLRHRSGRVDPKISLSFLPAGPKVHPNLLKSKITQHFKSLANEDLEPFVQDINGIGGYGQVIGMVGSLTDEGNRTVRGVVDWDAKNSPSEKVAVLGFEEFYTLENLMLNPLYLVLFLHRKEPVQYPLSLFCGKEVECREWMQDLDALQSTVDWMMHCYLAENNRDQEVEYGSGRKLIFDRRYLVCKGHKLKDFMADKFPALRDFKREGQLNYEMAKIMLTDFPDFIPVAFERLFQDLQKN